MCTYLHEFLVVSFMIIFCYITLGHFDLNRKKDFPMISKGDYKFILKEIDLSLIYRKRVEFHSVTPTRNYAIYFALVVIE